MELETTRQNCKESMEQTVLTERERFTQMQWDMEELRRKCLDLEVKLKSEQVYYIYCYIHLNIHVQSLRCLGFILQ